MKAFKKVLSLFVAACVVLSSLSLTAFAGSTPGKHPFTVNSASAYVNKLLSPTGNGFIDTDKKGVYNSGSSKVNDFDVSITSGVSGQTEDKALYLKTKSKNINNVFGIASDKSTGGCSGFTANYVVMYSHSQMPNLYKGRTGSFVIEFDIKADTINAGLGINTVPLWEERSKDTARYEQYYVMDPSGHWFGDETKPYEANKWYHVKMSLSRDGLWTVTYYDHEVSANVITIVKDAKQAESWQVTNGGNNPEYTNESKNMFLQFNHPNAGDAGFAIDNFAVYEEVESKVLIWDFAVDGGEASLKICNTTGADVTGTLIVAAYTNDELTGLYFKTNVTAEDGVSTQKSELAVDEGTAYKAMFWDADSKPLAAALNK